MAKTDIAYFAGFFDGEGCISIGRRRVYNQYFYALTISVTQKNRWILEWYKFNFGGRIYKRHKGEHEWFAWQVDSKTAATCLKTLLPYLKLKRAEAELALKFQEAKGKIMEKIGERRAVEEAQAILMHKLKDERSNS